MAPRESDPADDGRRDDDRQGESGPGFSEDAGYSDEIRYSEGIDYREDADYASGPFDFEAEHADESPTEDLGEPLGLDEDELRNLHYDASGMPLGPRKVLPLEDKPSALVARYLFPTEKFRGEWRKHWTYLADRFAIGAIGTFALGWAWGWLTKHHETGLAMAVIIIWAALMIFIAWKVADWYFDRFILTNKRIMAISGMFSRTVGMMPLLRVTDMKYDQTPMGRIFNYGNFVLESAGQDQALREIKHLPNPNELYLRIVEEMYEPEAVEAKLSHVSDDGS
jgi:membrane protein YdbS with pleckstrin-like domain